MPEAQRAPPLPAEIQTLLNKDIGPSVRTWVYSFFLAPDADGSHAASPCLAALCDGAAVSWTQRTLWSRARGPITKSMHGGMVRDAAFVATAVATLEAGLATLAAALPTLGPELVAAGVPNRIHLAIAAICAPLVFPPEAFVPFYGRDVVPLDMLPPAMRAGVDQFRATPVGQMTLRLYASCRLACVPPRPPQT